MPCGILIYTFNAKRRPLEFVWFLFVFHLLNKTVYFYDFEDYRLRPEDPSLWCRGELVAIPPKALEILTLLVTKKGDIVSREELIETVWKDTFVEEGNINYTISLLRKIFENKELIKTVPRHGYRFTAEVREISKTGGLSIQNVENPAETVVEKRSFRWVFGVVTAILLSSLAGFAYLSRGEKSINPSNIQSGQTSEAMQSYLRGKMILEKRSVENREEKAIDEFQKAVSLDPTLAIAYAGLAEGFATSAVKITYPKSRDTIVKAKVAAEKSLALEPNLAEGYMVRGWLKRNADWDWAGAESDLRRSIELSPKNAIAHQRLAQTLSIIGKHDEAVAESKIAYDLDPISEIIIAARFPILEARGDYDIALQESAEFLRENKASMPAARAYATFLYHDHNFREVIVIGEDAIKKNGAKTTFPWASLLSAAYFRLGELEKSNEYLTQLEEMSRKDSKARYSLAMNYAEIGRLDEALEALQSCFEQREERIIWLGNEPRFANIRRDSRFLTILSELNLR